MTNTTVEPSMQTAAGIAVKTASRDSILLLVRADDTEDAADQAYALVSITRSGLEALKKTGALVKSLQGDNALFSSAQFYAPAGIDAYLITDDDDDTLSILLEEAEAGSRAAVIAGDDAIGLAIADALADRSNMVCLEAIDEKRLSTLQSNFTPNFETDSCLLRFYDDEDVYFYFMFKYAAGSYSLDGVSIEMIARLFGEADEPEEKEDDD